LTSAHQKTGTIDGPLAFKIHKNFPSPLNADIRCWLSVLGFWPSTAAARGYLHQVERLYAHCEGGSIPQELCNGGIPVHELDAMKRDQAGVEGKPRSVHEQWGLSSGRRNSVSAAELGSRNLHKGCTG
jgi:hypothetical protein